MLSTTILTICSCISSSIELIFAFKNEHVFCQLLCCDIPTSTHNFVNNELQFSTSPACKLLLNSTIKFIVCKFGEDQFHLDCKYQGVQFQRVAGTA